LKEKPAADQGGKERENQGERENTSPGEIAGEQVKHASHDDHSGDKTTYGAQQYSAEFFAHMWLIQPHRSQAGYSDNAKQHGIQWCDI